MGSGVWGEVGGRVEGGLKEGGGVSLCFLSFGGFFMRGVGTAYLVDGR